MGSVDVACHKKTFLLLYASDLTICCKILFADNYSVCNKSANAPLST